MRFGSHPFRYRTRTAGRIDGMPMRFESPPLCHAGATYGRPAGAPAAMVRGLSRHLGVVGWGGVLERLSNRPDDRGRTSGGGEGALLLGQVGGSLMRMGC